MEEKSLSIVEEKIPPAAALAFIKGQVNEAVSKDNAEREKEAREPTKVKSAESGKAVTKKIARLKQEVPKMPEQYVLFSTKLRRSIQRQLAELRHQREMAGHPVRTIKQFIEESILLWLVEAEKSLKVRHEKQRIDATNELDPLEPFNNMIRADLKRKLKETSHQREMAGHTTKTIIAIVEEATTRWLLTL